MRASHQFYLDSCPLFDIRHKSGAGAYREFDIDARASSAQLYIIYLYAVYMLYSLFYITELGKHCKVSKLPKSPT